MEFQLYWGDLHSHCSISYGHGTVEQALQRARQQLDFCSVTGHAFWPDMPVDREQYGEIIDYHRNGFARLSQNWERLLQEQRQAAQTGSFLAFPSYEWHSLQYGDHNVYGMGPHLPLRNALDLPALRELARPADLLVIPHHIGYAAGYRGIDWNHFHEEASPFVEVFSLHGCSVDEASPYPMLHDMGPRDTQSTAEEGWNRGHRFGIVGGTDHHGAYPGSHGDGRMGVFARELTPEGLWEAFRARRVFAATGDKIDARLFVDGAWIGSVIRAPHLRRLQIEVRAPAGIQLVEVLRNGRVIRRCFPEIESTDYDETRPGRLRIAWGWGPNDRVSTWNARLQLSEGVIQSVDSCFSGEPLVAPKPVSEAGEISDADDLPHAILDQTERTCSWRSRTRGNPTMRHPAFQELSLEILAPLSACLTIEVNNRCIHHTLGELVNRGRSHYLRGWLSEALRVGPLEPAAACTVSDTFSDSPERETDVYRLRATQYNGQCVWLTPIWVER